MTWVSSFPPVVTAGTTVNWEDGSATVGFDVDAPNIPISIKPFIRANGSFGRKNNEAPESIFFNTLPFLGWAQAGVVIGYKL